MVNPIHLTGVGPAAGSGGAGAAAPNAPVEGGKFFELLKQGLDEVNKLQADADRSVEALYTGQTDDVASVLTAVNKAGVAFDLLMEIRNKLVDAYRDIQQMRV
jgi:flagellar hook-basal body complex protein FliE